MVKESKFPGIYEIRKKRRILLTKNLTPGKKVYDEKLIKEGKNEYREWNPKKSKLAAAILKNIKEIGIRKNDVVLYLGASYGTTVSHISDIIGKKGFIFALDFAPRVIRDLVFVCEERKNITPLFFDANHPEEYKNNITKQVDIVYQDVAQKNQAEIFLKNIEQFLRKEGYALLAVKARSIDITKNPRDIFNQIKEKLEKCLTVIDCKNLDPFERDHCMFVCKK